MKIKQARVRLQEPGQKMTHMQVSDAYREGTIDMADSSGEWMIPEDGQATAMKQEDNPDNASNV
ncbi:MAG: DUF4025 domain-containing protein [Alicyclobacillus sp.]|nr:DUF4025 domain-containing protein [Alicyclobacillus sp.]